MADETIRPRQRYVLMPPTSHKEIVARRDGLLDDSSRRIARVKAEVRQHKSSYMHAFQTGQDTQPHRQLLREKTDALRFLLVQRAALIRKLTPPGTSEDGTESAPQPKR